MLAHYYVVWALWHGTVNLLIRLVASFCLFHSQGSVSNLCILNIIASFCWALMSSQRVWNSEPFNPPCYCRLNIIAPVTSCFVEHSTWDCTIAVCIMLAHYYVVWALWHGTVNLLIRVVASFCLFHSQGSVSNLCSALMSSQRAKQYCL